MRVLALSHSSLATCSHPSSLATLSKRGAALHSPNILRYSPIAEKTPYRPLVNRGNPPLTLFGCGYQPHHINLDFLSARVPIPKHWVQYFEGKVCAGRVATDRE